VALPTYTFCFQFYYLEFSIKSCCLQNNNTYPSDWYELISLNAHH
jgi:hypothetical protein